jgi:hypothetical protein
MWRTEQEEKLDRSLPRSAKCKHSHLGSKMAVCACPKIRRLDPFCDHAMIWCGKHKQYVCKNCGAKDR